GSLKTHPLRETLDLWQRTWRHLRTDFVPTPTLFWQADPATQAQLRAEYHRHLGRTRFILCPRGRGLNSRRFFEAIAWGRIPVLYSDAARLPLEHLIDYDAFTVRVPEGYGRWTPDYLHAFLDRTNLETASKLARKAHETYLAPYRLRQFLEEA